MSKIVIAIILAIALISGCASPTEKTTPKEITPVPSNTVDIKGFIFEPNMITISSGTTVTWTNRDTSSHTITGEGFDSGSVSKDTTFNYTFNDRGTFEYRCAIHPVMKKGKVIVT